MTTIQVEGGIFADSYNKKIQNLISHFCDNTDEFKTTIFPDFTIRFVDDIYNTVKEDDYYYADTYLSQKNNYYGLCYVNLHNEFELLIKKMDVVNQAGTLFHEMTHIFDFFLLGQHMGETNYRKLQDNMFFVLWSEFHADYLTYLYLIKSGKNNIDEKEVFKQFLGELEKYANKSNKLDLQETADFLVRLYGKYMALQKIFSDTLKVYPDNFFINQNFLQLYKYLLNHRTFNSIKNNLEEVESIFKNLEN